MELLVEELPLKVAHLIVIARKEHTSILSKSDLGFGVDIPQSKILTFFGFGRKSAISSVIHTLKLNNVNCVLIPMAHPWDLKLQSSFQENNIGVVRIIHDVTRHPGDIWPRNFHIKKMLEVEKILTLSGSTAAKINESPGSTIRSSVHPHLPYLLPSRKQELDLLNKNYDLIIGRQKSYQNSKAVVKWWRGMPSSFKQGRHLIVAGRVGFLKKVFLKSRKIVVIDKWLTEQEFVDLIAGANRVLCLYREGSQSGVVSIAQQFGIPVMVSSVGGLPEQVLTHGGGIVADSNDISDWTRKYIELNKKAFILVRNDYPTKKFLADLMELVEI